MPDTLNKQTLINLLIDSPLREPIKINLIDIINNTSEPDLPKVFPTIVKELEIFQKATERRMKLADETITKLGGTSPASDTMSPVTAPNPTAPTPAPLTPPPLDLPPLPTPDTPVQPPVLEPATPAMPPLPDPVAPTVAPSPTPLSVPPLDLPPLPTVSAPEKPAEPVAPAPAPLPSPEPLGGPVPTQSSDEAALAEIQKELESLKAGVAADANPAPAATPTQA